MTLMILLFFVDAPTVEGVHGEISAFCLLWSLLKTPDQVVHGL